MFAGLLACLSRPAINEIYLLTISYVVLGTFLLIELSLDTTTVLRYGHSLCDPIVNGIGMYILFDNRNDENVYKWVCVGLWALAAALVRYSHT